MIVQAVEAAKILAVGMGASVLIALGLGYALHRALLWLMGYGDSE